MPNKPTNVEAMKRLMEFSRSGGLMQMFIIQAVKSYSEEVKKAKPEDWSNGMISFDAWQRCADEGLEFYEERTER